MESIGTTLKEYRKAKHLSQSDVAVLMGNEGYPTTLKSISTWERDTAVPNAKQFLALCRILNIRDIYGAFMDTVSQSFTIPLYLQSVSAGMGEYVDDTSYSVIETTNPRADYAVQIAGDSMEPLYKDGDIVLVHSTNTVSINSIAIFYVDGCQYCKQLGNNELVSVNPKYDSIPINDVTTFKILGEVISIYERSMDI